MKLLNALFVAACIALIPLPGNATVTDEEVRELIEYIERTMFPVKAVSSYRLSHMRDGKVLKSFGFEMTMQDDKNLLAMNWPATAKHKYLLKSGDNLWMYFSDVRRSIRLSSRDSFMGTDANNYDMMQLNIVKDYEVVGFSEEIRNEEPVLRIDLAARSNTDGYDRLVSWVSLSERRMLQNDCYSISGALIKSVHYHDPFEVDDYRIPGRVVIKSHVNKGRSTLLEISDVRPKRADEINSAMFTLGYLETVD